MTKTPARPETPNPAPADARARGRPLRRFLPALISFALVYWIGSGVYTVAPDERGVATRFGRIIERSVAPGMHYALPWPIDRVYTPRVTEVKRLKVGFTFLGKLYNELRRSDMLTGDENILKMELVIQYKIRDPIAYLFKSDQSHWLVERAVESAMSHRLASMTVDDMLTTARERFQLDVIAAAQAMLDHYDAGVTLLGGNLQDVSPPIPVLDAFTDVASAKKDAERAADEASSYAGRILPEARGEAQKLRSAAEGFLAERVNRAKGEADRFSNLLREYQSSPSVTRTRLFLESMERVFSQMKVIIIEPGSDSPGNRPAGSPTSRPYDLPDARRPRIQIVEPKP